MKYLYIALAVFTCIECTPKKSDQSTGPSTVNVEIIDVDKVADFIAQKEDLQIVDVRTEDEYVQGSLPGSVNMEIRAHNFEEQLATLDKEKPVLVYCARGGRSKRASDKMIQMGFKELYDIDGGYMKYEAFTR